MRQAFHKALLLASLPLKRPVEFYDRLMTLLEVRLERLSTSAPAYQSWQQQAVIAEMETHLRVQLVDLLREPALSEIEEIVHRRIARLGHEAAPFHLAHNADPALARLCFVACRALKPDTVLETGVAYGMTSAFILQALEINGRGTLHSVDLPPLGHEADRFVGILIPEALKHRWHLHRGKSKRVLPSLLPQLGRTDIFVHDSLHTYRNMQWELRIVTPYLTPQAIVIADDVEGNPAFLEWASQINPAFWAVMPGTEKEGFWGVSILGASSPYP
jgi:hypothetical protein